MSFGDAANTLLLMPAGSLVAFDGALPHASDPNRSDAWRRAMLVQYSRQPVEKDGALLAMAVPILRGGVHQTSSLERFPR